MAKGLEGATVQARNAPQCPLQPQETVRQDIHIVILVTIAIVVIIVIVVFETEAVRQDLAFIPNMTHLPCPKGRGATYCVLFWGSEGREENMETTIGFRV